MMDCWRPLILRTGKKISFAHAASLCRPHLRSQERHALRGLDREQELCTF